MFTKIIRVNIKNLSENEYTMYVKPVYVFRIHIFLNLQFANKSWSLARFVFTKLAHMYINNSENVFDYKEYLILNVLIL